MTPTTDAIKPGANKFFFGKRCDRIKVLKGNDTQSSGFSCFQTNRVPDGGRILEILPGKDGREMVYDVRVPSASDSRIVNEHMFFRPMRFRPVHLDCKQLTIVSAC